MDSNKKLFDRKITAREIIFALALIFCLTPFASPPIALAVGLIIALTIGHPFIHLNHKATKILLQVSVVGLGFGMNLGKIMQVGKEGIMFTIVSIFGTLGLGFIIGKWLSIHKKTSHLISSGTAICGGSAIAAVGPILNANDQEMSVALGTVFILNSIALFVFPAIGHLLNLSQTQFGFWAGIAIHDTSSVVGAAAKYGKVALQTATTVKLARALWIVPVALLTSFLFKNKSSKISIPYFIFLFILASIVRTYIAPVAEFSGHIVNAATVGLTVTLFLIGAGLSKNVLKTVGVKPLLQGVMLWIIISVSSLFIILKLVN
ncbi:MAG: putative sulfate exporter family transporter [Bacteroidetes bacterium]|nr:putative sulfate exporter family transporter [Bacteroidota bacterium]